mmetsp:Transcript_49579/g.112927  ORF Transcript_49579/g.112927 Transcript_49579/m.112927 type:complete len:217 (+) Transcript_49579:3-653(+)
MAQDQRADPPTRAAMVATEDAMAPAEPRLAERQRPAGDLITSTVQVPAAALPRVLGLRGFGLQGSTIAAIKTQSGVRRIELRGVPGLPESHSAPLLKEEKPVEGEVRHRLVDITGTPESVDACCLLVNAVLRNDYRRLGQRSKRLEVEAALREKLTPHSLEELKRLSGAYAELEGCVAESGMPPRHLLLAGDTTSIRNAVDMLSRLPPPPRRKSSG